MKIQSIADAKRIADSAMTMADVLSTEPSEPPGITPEPDILLDGWSNDQPKPSWVIDAEMNGHTVNWSNFVDLHRKFGNEAREPGGNRTPESWTLKPPDLQEPLVPGSGPPMREPGTAKYVDIGALLDGGGLDALKPAVLKRTDGHSLFYAGQVNSVFGDPEGGKTWVCLAAVVEGLRADARALIVDLDHNGAAATIARLIALGARVEALRDQERFRYIEPEDHFELLEVIEDMRVWEPTIAVVDSIGELLPLFGFNSNSADDFTSVHTRVLKPLARVGACVLAVDHLAKGQDSRAQGPSGTAAKRRAVGGVSMRVKVKETFVPGEGGSAYLSVNKDRHGGVREHCPTGEVEAPAGLFVLHAFADGILEWEVKAPDGSSAPTDAADAVPNADVAAVAALVPPPTTVEDARERLGWQKQRAGRAVKVWRERESPVPGSRSGGSEPGTADE